MKKIIITLTLISGIGFASCKKTRTCSCTSTSTETTTTTPQNGSAGDPPSTYVNVSQSEDSYAHVSKSDMRKFEGCVSGTQTSTRTYTTMAFVTAPTPTYVPADVTDVTVTTGDCTIK